MGFAVARDESILLFGCINTEEVSDVVVAVSIGEFGVNNIFLYGKLLFWTTFDVRIAWRESGGQNKHKK